MSTSSIPTEEVKETVPLINDEIAVGEDLDFQRRWWKFEKAIWILFILLVLLDVAGAFGRGPLANAQAASPDGAMTIKYERIERFRTPSILTVRFSQAAVHNGQVKLWASDTLVTRLGNQRVIPQPVSTVVGNGGYLYTFEAAGQPPTLVQFALEPGLPGLTNLVLRAEGSTEVPLKFAVMP